MIRKVLYLFLIIVLMHIVYACCKPDKEYYDWIEINTINLDNSKSYPIISENDSILKEAYGMRIELIPEDLFMLVGLPFISSSYAFSTCDADLIANSTIDKIQMYTAEKFDANHSEGSEITEYIGLRDVGSYNAQYKEINDYLSDLNQKIEDRVVDSSPEFELFLLQAPEQGGVYHFTLVVSFSNQNTLTNTIAVKLY